MEKFNIKLREAKLRKELEKHKVKEANLQQKKQIR